MKVLLIEDEAKIAAFTVKGLSAQGFLCDHFADGETGLIAALHGGHDAIVLDIMLPGRDGLSVLRELRKRGVNTPIILLTARGTLEDRVEGLNLGADDYLPKPFFVEELAARLFALERRVAGVQLNVRRSGELVLNLATRMVEIAGTEVALTAREFNLLEYLLRQPGRVYTRIQILEHVWNYSFDPQTNLVDVYIQRIRRKLREAQADGGECIETVRGVGYRVRGETAAGGTAK